MGRWVKVANVQEIPPQQARVVEAEGQAIALSHVEGRFYAIQDLCTHDNGPLGEGTLWGEEIECPRHGARFNVKTGQPVTLPAVVPVRTFPVKVDGGGIFIQLD